MKLTTAPKSALKYYLEYLVIEKGFSKLTIGNYKSHLTKFVNWLEKNNHSDLLKVDLKIINDYRKYLLNYGGLSRRTQVQHVISLRLLFAFLIKRGFDVLDPQKIEISRVAGKITKFLNPKMIEKLLNSPVLSKPGGLRDRVILEVLFSTGLRVGELVSLNIDQIDLESKQFSIVGKGGKPRLVFLTTDAVDWIGRYLNSRLDRWKPLFTRISGRKAPIYSEGLEMRLTKRSIQAMVEKYCIKANLPFKISPHGIRHSFATDLLNNGASLRDIQEMLGHASLSSVQIYTHVTQNRLKEIHEKCHTTF